MRFSALQLFTGVFALGLTACEPCSGVASCNRGDYLAAAGQIVDAETGHGIAGVRLDFLRAGGIDVAADSMATVSNEEGFWQVEFAPREAGGLLVDVRVSAPHEDPYVIRNLALTTRLHGGDANLNERWVTRLYLNYWAELYYEGTADTRVAGARVEFRQTSGVELFGPGITESVHVGGTDIGGRVNLFPNVGSNSVYAREEAPLVGDLVVTVPDGRTAVVRGVTLIPTHLYRQTAIIARAAISP